MQILLTFVLVNTFGTECDLRNTGYCQPPKKRSVTINLTPEQIAQIGIREVGERNIAYPSGYEKQIVYERISEVFTETICKKEIKTK